MLESLPRLYETEDDQPKIETSATDETTLKVCEYNRPGYWETG